MSQSSTINQDAEQSAYTADQLERVVKRAAELQSLAGDGEPPSFSEEELIRIAEDVGIDARHVQEALSELQAQAVLAQSEQDENLFMQYLFGSSQTLVSRRLSGRRETVQAAIEDQLEQEQGMQPVRRTAGLSVWEPSGDLGDMVQRLVDFSGRRFKLAEAESISLNVSQWDREHVVASLSGDLSNQRNEWAGWWLAGVIIAVVMAWGWFGDSGAPSSWLLFSAIGLAGLVVAIFDVRRNLRREKRKIALILEGLFDRLGA